MENGGGAKNFCHHQTPIYIISQLLAHKKKGGGKREARFFFLSPRGRKCICGSGIRRVSGSVFVTFGLGKVERKRLERAKLFPPANLALFSSLAKKTFCDRDFFPECKIQNSLEIDWWNFSGGGNKRDYFLGFTPNFSTDAEEIRAKVASFPFSAFLSPPHIQRERESEAAALCHRCCEVRLSLPPSLDRSQISKEGGSL